MKRTSILGILALILSSILLISLTACQSTTSTSNTPTSTPSGKTEIDWWTFPIFTNDANGTYSKEIIAAFEKQHPDIKVNLKLLDFSTGPDKLDTAIAKGTVGDVLFDAPGRIISYGKTGNLVPLDDLFTDSFTKDVGNAALIKACKDGDTAYMYPLSSAPFYMAFNTAMLSDAGVLDRVHNGWTTDDFTAVLTALHAKGYVPGSIFCSDTGGDQGTRAFVTNLYSATMTDNRLNAYTINSDAGVKGLTWMDNAIDKGLILRGDTYNGTDEIANFVAGNASFSLLWGASQQNSNQAALDANGITALSVPYPSDDGVPELEYLVNGLAVFDSGDNAKIEASKTFIKFLCDDTTWGPKNVVQSGCIPVRKSFGDLYHTPQMTQVKEWTRYYGVYYNTIDGFSDMRINWRNMLRAILLDGADPKEAANGFTTRANTTITSKPTPKGTTK